MILRSRQAFHQGATTPFMAILMVPILGMVAFAVDMGYVCWTQGELQNAADAAALAGASQLILPQVPGGSNQDAAAQAAVTNAKAEARTFAAYNRAGGASLTLLDADIAVGYQGPSATSSLAAWTTGASFPNTVQVITRRDSSANASLSLFFAPVIGVRTWNGTATATAQVKPSKYVVTGFSPASGKNPLLLPIGVDVNFWNTFVTTGRSPDGQVHDSFTARIPTATSRPPVNVSNGADSVPELTDVYPNSVSPGNFGLVNLNFTNFENNTPEFENWILYGPTPEDMRSFGPDGFQATPATPVEIKGGPGMKSSLQTELESIIGQPRAVPLFASIRGNGSSTYYTIVGFAGVTVVGANGRGSNMEISFQPMIAIDPTATTSSSATTITQFVYPASPLELTR